MGSNSQSVQDSLLSELRILANNTGAPWSHIFRLLDMRLSEGEPLPQSWDVERESK